MTTATVGMVGNLTDDPELRFSAAGKPFATFRLCMKPYVPGADVQPDPIYHSVVCFGSLAENVSEQCRKGQRVVVTGRLESDTWTGRDGNERVTLKIVADGIGPDLRFSEPAKRTEPVGSKSSKMADELLGPAPATSELEPF